MSAGRLVFDGDIEFLDPTTTEDGYWFEAVEGISFGQAVPVEAILTSLLRDGSLVSKTGDDNREVALPFRVCGTDLLALAEGEKRIGLAIGRRTTLEWTPPDGIGPTTVFDVMTSDLDNPPMDDLAELRNRRTYTLKLTCLPFGRSVDKIIDNAGTAPSGGGTVVNSCETLSEWQYVQVATAPAELDTAVFYEGSGSIRTYPYSMPTYDSTWDYWSALNQEVWQGSISTGAGGYMSIVVRPDWPDSFERNGPKGPTLSVRLYTTADTRGQVVSVTASEVLPGGWIRYVWQVGAGLMVNRLEFGFWQYSITGSPSMPTTRYDAISLSTTATSDHQIVKTIDVEGSARAPGALHVAAPDDSVALGSVLAITASADEVPPGFGPDIRRYVVSGSTSTDTTALHGSYYQCGSTYGTPAFEVPVSTLLPGPYTLVVLGQSNDTLISAMSARAQLKVGGVTTGPTSEAGTYTWGDTNWHLMTFGTIYLPPLPMQSADSSAVVRMEFKGTFKLADAFVIPQAADFSIVDCGTGTVSGAAASSHLWIDSPSPDQPQGGWWRGPVVNRANARSAWPDAKWPGRHVFEPGRMSAWLVSTGAAGPTLSLEYFPHWRTNAAL